MPARHKSLQTICFQEANPIGALVDERGCRRDIRSNGWIVFLERVRSSKTGPVEETGFSSFGADLLELRNFTGVQSPKVKSGPDVFADALVPVAAQLAPAL